MGQIHRREIKFLLNCCFGDTLNIRKSVQWFLPTSDYSGMAAASDCGFNYIFGMARPVNHNFNVEQEHILCSMHNSQTRNVCSCRCRKTHLGFCCPWSSNKRITIWLFLRFGRSSHILLCVVQSIQYIY